ncbi:MAG: FGGY-family carbohydrate kinase [Actinomycetota bacterium]
MDLYLGLDFGTSGARAVIIDTKGAIHTEAHYLFSDSQVAVAPSAAQQQSTPAELPNLWQRALFALIEQIPPAMRRVVSAIAIDGTSATVLLCDANGNPVRTPILYNEARVEVMEELTAIAPPNHPVLTATSSLAKLLWWLTTDVTENQPSSLFSPATVSGIAASNEPLYFLHQADWLAFLLHGKLGISDYHNALKLGYDVATLSYPNWLTSAIARYSQRMALQLPEIITPGTPVGEVTAEMCDRFDFPNNCRVCAGTTDSIAAFFASGAQSPGEASTSLGSTLAVKLLSHTRVDDARYGIYSHRFGDLWLVGGASNTGGAVLRKFFTDAELANLSSKINPATNTCLDYYPLLKPGDRFPINDPNLPPRLEPRPTNSVEFLQGLLESIARLEARGYQLLQEFGSTPLTRVYTAGGGAKNPAWTAIRQRYLKVPVVTPVHTAAAYGAALLAMRGVNH